MSEAVDSVNPYLPVDLPEFGVSVGWAMCRNTMCRNFGIQYAGPAHTNETWLTDKRYEINPKTGEFKCGHCGSSFTLTSNRAIRVLARHFLSRSLPFATCPEQGCENYGHNVFENYTPHRARDRRYRRHQSDHRVLCRMCTPKRTTFPLGVPKYLERHSKKDSPREVRKKDRAALRRLRAILKGVMYYRSVWGILEDVEVDADTCYTQLVRAGERLRDYHAWRNAKLLHKKFARHDAPLRVYTDTLRVSLARYGKETPGFTYLDIPVSVVDLPQDRTYYVLAAHPGFLPEQYCQADLRAAVEGRFGTGAPVAVGVHLPPGTPWQAR